MASSVGMKKCSSSVEVLSVLRDFRRTKKFCDITLKCRERNFYAHCCVLAAVSPYFLAMFRSGMSEVYTNVKTVDLAFLSVSPSVVTTVLDYIYGEAIEIDLSNAFELLAIADYMLLNPLKNELCVYLGENMSLERPELVFATRRSAEMFGCKTLYENTNCFIKATFYRLSQTSAFLDLSFGDLEYFLESNDLSANENEVFESIVKWVRHSLEKRKTFLGQLLNCVQSNTLSKEYCTYILTQHNATELLDCFENEFFQTSINDSGADSDWREGQEVMLVFGNEKSQAYTPGPNPWHAISHIPEAKQNFKVVILNGFVYVLGGTSKRSLSLTVWRYNPNTNHWKEMAPMLKTAASFAVVALAGYLYATGGPNPKYNMQKYDPDLDMWCFDTPMQVVRIDHCMVAFQGQFLVAIGGYTPMNSLYSVEKYDADTSTWTYMPQLNVGRLEASAVVLEENIFVVGGYSGTSPPELSSCEVYRSSTNAWSLIEPTVTPRRNAGITIYHGKVYILGGKSRSSNFEYFCEESKSWKSDDSCIYNSFCQCCTVVLTGKQICNLYKN